MGVEGVPAETKRAVAFLSIAWVGLLATGRFLEVAEALIGLGMAWVVPLGVSLASRSRRGRGARAGGVWISRIVGTGATFGLASFCFSKGPVSTALACAWLLTTIVIASTALQRFAARGFGPLEELAIDAGHLYLPVGAVWLVASRGEVALLGFHEPIVLYTAAHFHFAGFAAPVVAGLLGAELFEGADTPSRRLRSLYVAQTIVVLAGIPLVAAGIQISHRLEMPAAILLGAGMLTMACLLFVAGRRRWMRANDTRWTGALLAVAGLSLVFSMSLAIAFTTTGSTTRDAAAPLVPYALMAALHGVANAGGFASVAILAFTLAPPPAPPRLERRDFTKLFGKGFIGPDFFERAGAVEKGRDVAGQLRSLDAFAWRGFSPAAVHPLVRDFYESTRSYRLVVLPRWHVPFRVAGRIFARFARRFLGQLELPTRAEDDEMVTTRLFGVRADRDGRTDVRGYVRTYGVGASTRANYVAACSTRKGSDRLLLSAAFPLPFCALVGVLRFEDGPRAGGLSLSSRPLTEDRHPNEGMFLATPIGPIRLPVEEQIDVWAAEDGGMQASHRVKLLGLRCFSLAYTIEPLSQPPP